MRLYIMTCACFRYTSIAILLFISACAPSPDFTTLPDGSKWKLLAFDEQTERLDSAGLVIMHISALSHPYGDTIASHYSGSFVPDDSEIWKFLRNRFVSDSLSYICASQSGFPGINGADSLQYNIRLLKIRTLSMLRDARMLELLSLDSLIRNDTISGRFSEHSGIWYRTISEGDTSQVREGLEVALHYSGRTLYGRAVDDSRMGSGLLRFVVGQENQVLPGIEAVLERLHKGEIAEVIIPSWLAYGERGSGAGIVQPFTTMVYIVEVHDLARE